MGRMNSSIRISPTLTGLRFVVNMLASPVAMVVEIDAQRFAARRAIATQKLLFCGCQSHAYVIGTLGANGV
jgi:hypothetical protein